MIEAAKKNLRQEMRAQRLSLSAEKKLTYEANLENQTLALIKQRSARSVHIYLSLAEEINTQGIIEFCWNNGIKVIVPETLAAGQLRHLEYRPEDELISGSFQCKWPKHDREHHGGLDLIICPGLAFSLKGNRLGYGGGYYDRFLIKHPQTYKVGLAFPFQIKESIPSDQHDCVMDQILIPNTK
jgi:5-formyltetrahydrofolate cyclo-ligase